MTRIRCSSSNRASSHYRFKCWTVALFILTLQLAILVYLIVTKNHSLRDNSSADALNDVDAFEDSIGLVGGSEDGDTNDPSVVNGADMFLDSVGPSSAPESNSVAHLEKNSKSTLPTIYPSKGMLFSVPSVVHTNSPTAPFISNPSANQSALLTENPSASSISKPSSLATNNPSAVDSAKPSTLQSTNPSKIPTENPLASASYKPSQPPTGNPSTLANANLSVLPTANPPVLPTANISAANHFGTGFVVLSTIPHDPTSFTQGLVYANGVLYESTGLYRKSKVRRLEISTGATLTSVNLDDQYFGEGLAFYPKNNTLVQVTWKKRTGFVYDAISLEKLYTFKFSTGRNEGWGITYYPITNTFIVSDGSDQLYFWDVNLFKETGRVTVKWPDGRTLDNLNELEYDPVTNNVLSNVWMEDHVIAICPLTGIIQADIDLSSLWPYSERPRSANVLNGISTTDVMGEYLFTGKKWPDIYKVAFI